MPRRGLADPIAQEFGAAIKTARTDRGETLDQVANRIESMDAKYLGEIERGWHAPTIPTAKRIADALGVPLGNSSATYKVGDPGTVGTWLLSGHDQRHYQRDIDLCCRVCQHVYRYHRKGHESERLKGVTDHDEQQADQADAAASERQTAGGGGEREDRAGAGSPQEQFAGASGEVAGVSGAPALSGLTFPRQTPLFHAQHAERYARQDLIRYYEDRFDCRLIVMIDAIFPYGVTLLEELLVGADPTKDLHLVLDSPGGDGETAVRLVRAAQARCHALTVIVPNQAKSAGTILVMGAHRILMGPTSDLGPVDPQFQSPAGGGLYSAKDLIAAVENADAAIAANPESYPLHVSLLADVTAVMVQQARSALGRTGDLVREALKSHPERSADDVDRIASALKEKLIDLPLDHGAVFNAADAQDAGLPVTEADPESEQWRIVWHLWTKYFQLGPASVYEGRLASQVIPRSTPQ